MNVFRLLLLALAVVVFAAIGWRLLTPSGPSPARPAIVATRPAVVAVDTPSPKPPAPVQPAPAEMAKNTAPGQPAAPATPPVLAPPAQVAGDAPRDAAPSAPARPMAPAPPATLDDARRAVLADLAAAPDLDRVFKAVQQAFPAVAARSLDAAARARMSKDDPTTPDDVISALMRDARADAGVLAAHAGPEALATLFGAKAATLADLEAADPRICADYLFGSSSPEFVDFAVTHRGLVAAQDLALVAAMVDGRNRQITRDTPSDADYAGIETALRVRGLSTDEIAAVLDGKTLDPQPPDARLCSNARAYLAAIQSLPEDARERVYSLAADLLARS